jgi:2,3-bisphosphoglycerate-dependent phosphoglycerate mutase
MTSIYFVRHAEPDHNWADERTRPLTKAGKHDCKSIVGFFKDKDIQYFLSSPYKRSIDTIKSTSDFFHLNIELDERLRERKAGLESNNEDMFYRR